MTSPDSYERQKHRVLARCKEELPQFTWKLEPFYEGAGLACVGIHGKIRIEIDQQAGPCHSFSCCWNPEPGKQIALPTATWGESPRECIESRLWQYQQAEATIAALATEMQTLRRLIGPEKTEEASE